jgi:hypothetical protein
MVRVCANILGAPGAQRTPHSRAEHVNIAVAAVVAKRGDRPPAELARAADGLHFR